MYSTQVSFPTAGGVAIIAKATDVSGTAFTAFDSAACNALDIVNTTGHAIEYRRNGVGATITVPDNSSRLVVGVRDAANISFRRVDQSATPVTLTAEALVP